MGDITILETHRIGSVSYTHLDVYKRQEVPGMSIIWKYLDKRSAAVDALKDYGSMKFIIGHTDDEIKSAYEKMEGISSPQLDGMPRSHNPQASEERIVKGIEEIDVLKERYRQAVEYICLLYTSVGDLHGCERHEKMGTAGKLRS